ncbi:MAG: hypothetical protein U0900_12490 [Myxococcota bacterium]
MRNWRGVALCATAALLLGSTASAQVYGSLGNFDVVNKTGHDCQGFEIEIDDPTYDHTKIISVFGLDRNFGVPPTSVERYGAPTITDVPGGGVRIRYQAQFANGQWSTHTPSGPYAYPFDSCWSLGNAQYNSGALSCDHFGVGTYDNPSAVQYSWLCDESPGSDSGVLTPNPASIPPVNFAYQPAPPPPPGQLPQPEPVQVHIEAPPEPAQPDDIFGRAYWVQVYSRHADHNVALEDLMVGNPEVPDDSEVEVEWEIFQEGGDAGVLEDQLLKDPADDALVLRFAFYDYVGPVTAEGEADCGGHGVQATPENCGGLGEYVGAQMAAFNALAVPEPGLAQPIALLGLVALARRRSIQRRD